MLSSQDTNQHSFDILALARWGFNRWAIAPDPCFLNACLFSSTWKSNWDRDLPSPGSLPRTYLSQGWVNLKSGTQIFIWVSQVGDRGETPEPLFSAFQEVRSRCGPPPPLGSLIQCTTLHLLILNWKEYFSDKTFVYPLILIIVSFVGRTMKQAVILTSVNVVNFYVQNCCSWIEL